MAELDVIDQAVTDQAAEGETEATTPTEQEGENRQVPVSVLNAMREEMKTIKEQNKLYQAKLQDQVQPQTQQVQQPFDQPTVADPLDGRQDDDLISVADVKKILETTSKSSQQTSTELKAQLAKIGFMAEHPDYKDVLNGLKDAMAGNDELATMLNTQIQQSHNPLQAAYAFAKAVGIGAKKQSTPETDALSELERILANQEKPGSPSAVSGGTGTTSSKTKFDNMTPDEFEKHLASIKHG